MLQDIGLAIHPPLLYLGYVGCSISFAFAVAALIDGRIDAAWARWVRPWTLTAWLFLTLGIAMGSYWAYYELGWGGFWFWDPVENASLMPWLVTTALLHSAIVMEKRDALKIWTVLLAILAFSLSLIGTFLVRSGVLTSVHAFASDPTRGIFILVILCLFIGGALSLFAFRAGTLAPGGIFAPISREGALVLNNLFLTAAAATVVVGTLYPLALEALTGTRISVGAPFFNLTFAPAGRSAAPHRPLSARSWPGSGATVGGATPALDGRLRRRDPLDGGRRRAHRRAERARHLRRRAGGLADCRCAVRACLPHPPRLGLARRQLPPADRPAAFGFGHDRRPCRGRHGGARHRRGLILVDREHPHHAPGRHHYDRRARRSSSTASISARGRTITEKAVHFTVSRGGAVETTAEPAKRKFPVRGSETTEAAIKTFWFSQLYVSLGDIADDGAVTVRIYWKSAGDVDLARRDRHGFRRASLAQRSAAPRRRAAAGPPRRGGSGGTG